MSARFDISPIAKSDVSILSREANRAARRVVHRLGLPPCDIDDVRQDILTDLIERMSKFDPKRGPLGPFAGTVARHHASRLASRSTREVRMWSEVPLISSEGGNADTSSWLVDRTSDPSRSVQLRLDVDRALKRLKPQEVELVFDLMTRSAAEIADSSSKSRATAYRRIRDVRLSLTALGLVAI